MTTSASTFAAVFATRLSHDAARPFLTFYDESTGERVELSFTTWANWVAKASSLLIDELDLERGMTIRLDLPPHWLGTVFAGAAFSTGLVVTDGEAPDVVVTGPDGVETWAASGATVLACSLLPLGVRFATPLPPSVIDVGVAIWSQPDAFISFDPPQGDDLVAETALGRRTQAEMWGAAAASPARGRPEESRQRFLTATNPASPPGFVGLVEPLISGGSVVLVVGASPERRAEIARIENVTDELAS